MTVRELLRRSAFIKFLIAKRKAIVEVISALFILLFLYTALSKSFSIGSTVNALNRTPGFSNYSFVVAWGIVILEYITVGLLFVPRLRKVGLFTSLLLMIGFTVYIAYMKAFVAQLPCSCGGVISKLNWNQHLVFNVFFILLALGGIILMEKDFKSESGGENIPIVFT